jgi:hypothetical protein
MMKEESPSILETLFECAGRYYEQRQAQAALVRTQIAELKEQITKKQEELEQINFSPELFANFRGRIVNRYQCPRCWVLDGVIAWLGPIPGDTSDDLFRCDKCNADFAGVERGDGQVFRG